MDGDFPCFVMHSKYTLSHFSRLGVESKRVSPHYCQTCKPFRKSMQKNKRPLAFPFIFSWSKNLVYRVNIKAHFLLGKFAVNYDCLITCCLWLSFRIKFSFNAKKLFFYRIIVFYRINLKWKQKLWYVVHYVVAVEI